MYIFINLSVLYDHLKMIFFLQIIGRAWPGANPLLPNSSETAWNFQMPFYRKDSGTLRMVYVNFHKPICPRDFSMTISYFCGGLPNVSACYQARK